VFRDLGAACQWSLWAGIGTEYSGLSHAWAALLECMRRSGIIHPWSRGLIRTMQQPAAAHDWWRARARVQGKRADPASWHCSLPQLQILIEILAGWLVGRWFSGGAGSSILLAANTVFGP